MSLKQICTILGAMEKRNIQRQLEIKKSLEELYGLFVEYLEGLATPEPRENIVGNVKQIDFNKMNDD